MNQVTTLVDQSSATNLGSSLLFTSCLEVMRVVRKIWNCARHLFELFSYKDNQVKFNVTYAKQGALGIAAYIFFGENKILRCSAWVFLIARRILECNDRHNAFAEACSNWMKYAFRGEYRTVINNEINLQTFPVLTHLKEKGKSIYIRIENIVKYSFEVLKSAFLLCMSYLDIYDCISLSKETGDHAVREFIINYSKTMDTLISNRDDYLAFFDQHEKTVNSVISYLGMPFDAKSLKSGTEFALNGLDMFHTGVKKVSEFFGHGFIQTLKKGASTLSISSGWNSYFGTPQWLVPDHDP